MHAVHARGQRGFSIVSAIFLLVVLAAFGAFMVTFSTVQQTTSTQDVQGARAAQAARAGIEWGTYRILRVSPAGCAGSTPLTFGGTLSGFGVVVQCSSTAYDEGGNAVTLYRLVSTANNGGAVGSTGFVERQMEAVVER